MRRFDSILAILVLALALVGAKFGSSSTETLSSASTPPTIPRWSNKTWLRTSDDAYFIYDETKGKLVNTQKLRLRFAGNGAPFSAGGLGLAGTGLVSDTTSALPNGFVLRKTMTLRSAIFQSDAVSPACSLRVYKQQYGASPTLVNQFVCNLNVKFFEGLSATADSGDIITCYLSTNTNRPAIDLEWSEEITPP